MAADPVCTDPDKYQVIFENDRVRVLEYRDLPGGKTLPHQHPDSVMYTLSSAGCTSAWARAMSSWNRAAPTGCQPRPTRARTPAPRPRTCCSSSSRRQKPPGRFTAAVAAAGMPAAPACHRAFLTPRRTGARRCPPGIPDSGEGHSTRCRTCQARSAPSARTCPRLPSTASAPST